MREGDKGFFQVVFIHIALIFAIALRFMPITGVHTYLSIPAYKKPPLREQVSASYVSG